MKFNSVPIMGASLIDIEPRADERGMFARLFCQKEFKEHGIDFTVAQMNVSRCTSRGTIRGLHWQAEPYGEPKLFRCTRGEIYQAIVDLRPASPTFRSWYGVRLDAEGCRMLYVPPGCANGYEALADGTEVTYLAGEFYHGESEHGIRWNDPSFSIEWPIREGVMLSPKDAAWPDWKAGS
jgi:dTDP-4-dehydrorhamnose 3,5-epimerase